MGDEIIRAVRAHSDLRDDEAFAGLEHPPLRDHIGRRGRLRKLPDDIDSEVRRDRERHAAGRNSTAYMVKSA
jgi:hypothetical protein